MDWADALNPAVDMLRSLDKSLDSLAELSTRDVFDFYRSADLRGVDLSGQDLRGLRFHKSDLRFANLSHVSIDPGALNTAILDLSNVELVDDYDVSIEEVLNIDEKLSYVWFMAQFRPTSLEYAIGVTAMPYYEFAKFSGINLQTLRRARRGLTVSKDTALSICRVLDTRPLLFSEESLLTKEQRRHLSRDINILRQPSLKIIGNAQDGGHHVPRAELDDFLPYFSSDYGPKSIADIIG